MVKIVLDAFGGDYAPVETVRGAVLAVNKNSNIHVILTGNEEEIKKNLAEYKYNPEQISIINAEEVITNDDVPTVAIRSKKNSSLVVGLDETKNNEEVVGFVSAGSTGAVLTGAFMKLGRLKGVHRPALCPILPTLKGSITSICDCGANMDCKPEYLEQFALMGSAYLTVLGVENPRVALLNVGTEDHKGDARAKETFALLKEKQDAINFVGNMEARDLLTGDYDLVVTDAFAGNVLLKSTEGALKSLLKIIKREIKASFWAKFGYLFMRKAFKNIKNTFDYSHQGGAVLLGCKKLLVKGHGNSKGESICACLEQIYTMSEGKLTEKIAENLKFEETTDNE